MKKLSLFKGLLLATFFCVPFLMNAQVTIGSGATPQATLDVVGATGTPAGIVAPRVSRAYLNSSAHGAAQTGAIVFVGVLDGVASGSATNVIAIGYYFFDGAVWQSFASPAEFWLPSFNLPWDSGQTLTVNLFAIYQSAFLGQTNPRFAASPGFPYTGVVPGHNPNAVATDFFYVITGWDPAVITNVSVNANGVLTYTCTTTAPAGGVGYLNVMMVRR